ELYNTTNELINIGGWYLSDSGNTPRKYQIPPGTTLPPDSAIVFTESHFNPTPQNPATNHFALDGSEGDDVWLTVVDSTGRITTFVDEIHFGGTLDGHSLGRVPNGTGRLVPLGRTSLGCENTGVSAMGVVISEIQYQPGPPSPAA